MWANPTSPNLPDFMLFVQYSMGIDPLYLPQTIAAPAAPALTAGAAGTLPTEPVYVWVTYLSVYGETTPSAAASISVTGPTGSVVVASPAAAVNAIGYNIYAASAAGGEVLQNVSPVAIGAAYEIAALATGTAAPPAINTTPSPFMGYAFWRAMGLAIRMPCSGIDYTLAVYNCGGHILISTAPDQPGRSKEDGSFTQARVGYELLKLSAGMVQSTSDNGTSTSLAVPDALKQLTLSDLGFMKTPYGREYIAYNQDFGDVFGIT